MRGVVIRRISRCKEVGSPSSIPGVGSMAELQLSGSEETGSIMFPLLSTSRSSPGLLPPCLVAPELSPCKGDMVAATAAYVTGACGGGSCVRLCRRGHVAYTGCHRRNGPNFGRVFLMLKYTDITQNTYIQSRTITEIMAREV